MSRLRSTFVFLVAAGIIWLLITVSFVHWTEEREKNNLVDAAFENADKKLHEQLNFRLDNFDARNVRQLADLRDEIKALRKQIDRLSVGSPNADTPARRSETPSTTQHPPTTMRNPPATMRNPPATMRPSPSTKVVLKNLKRPMNTADTAILVITCNRVNYLKQTLEQVLEKRPPGNQFSVIVSQDCDHGPTSDYLAQHEGKIKVIKQPDLSPITITDLKLKKMEGYFKISRHYKFALNQVFDVLGFEYAIIIEDDLDIAPDFFSYFSATKYLLDEDPTIWCVSAWNDNGKEGYVSGNEILYRSDFFPGLGWMLKKTVWLELKPKWPASFWDDWMREPSQRNDRVCIRPEVCRTKTFGYKGVSKGEFSPFLKLIKLNDQPVDFSKIDLNYLKKDSFDSEFLARVYSSPELLESQIISGYSPDLKEVRITYSGIKQFQALSKRLGIMSDWKAGVPRAAYKGIVTIFFRNRRLFITPPK